MKVKTITIDGKTYAVLDAEGNPVYVHDDGKEIGFDAKSAVDRINAVNSEAKGHRIRAETAEKTLKDFEGITDPAAAKKALETVKNIDEGQLIAAGKVEEIKNAAKRTAEEAVAAANAENSRKLEEANKKNEELTGQLYSEKVGSAFSNSAFIKDKIAVPADMLRDSFGKYFKIEDGEIVAYESDGKTKVYSRKDHGTPAKFEEALEIIVDRYPNKDHLLKGTGSGSGGRQGNGSTQQQNEQLAKLPAADRLNAYRQAQSANQK